ncbi:hypothetical protein EV360DRAFT_81673 [Lentinula raphanica]|nr:hypothetical protein EV360DRAFT_81673 [Lentinula raphanica]
MANPLNAIISPDPREEEFTFPKRDGSTFKAKIMSMRVPDLKTLCGEVGQPRSGSKAILQERLKAFSGNTDQWKILQPGARRSHKGSRTNDTSGKETETKCSKKPSAYVQRRNALFGGAQSTGPIQRSKDSRTEQEKAEMLAWAAEMSNVFQDFQTPREANTDEPLFPTPAIRERKIEAQLSTIIELVQYGVASTKAVASTAAEPPSFMLPLAPPPTPFDQVAASTPINVETLRHRLTAASSPRVINNGQSLSSAPSVSVLPSSDPVVSCPPPFIPALPPPSTPTEKVSHAMRKLVLANGTVITFSPSTVPDPPLVSFADDIPKLVRMWDDAAPDYQVTECLLKVEGHGIPLRLWEHVYKYGGDQRWKGTKDKWGKWKFVVEAYNRLGKDKFWAKYRDTKNDKPMSYTAIVEELRKERKVSDALVTARVREHFGDEFKDKFTYRGQQLVRPSAIAKRSRTIQI